MIATTITQNHVEKMDLTQQLNQFFIKHEKKAFTIANISLKNQDDAMDVVQDVMIKFVEKYKNRDPKIWTLLFYRMIQNRITDFHRQNTKKDRFFSFINTEDKVEKIPDINYVSALQKIEDTIKIKNLQKSLNILSTRQSQAFVCRIWEGLSVAETAKSMKCSQGSVKTHLYRAIQHIRSEVEEHG